MMKGLVLVILGFIVGSVVNMGLIIVSPDVIPPPPGVDVTDMESLAASMHLFQPQHFIMPFLAHALGTFAGALVAAFAGRGHALFIGAFFFIGGLVNVFLLPSPAWFIALDLSVAYFPMAFVAARLVVKDDVPRKKLA